MRVQLILGATTAWTLALAGVADRVEAQPSSLSFDTLFYSDTDNVIVVSPQVAAHRVLDEEGGEASARVAVDVISAASVDVVSQATSRFNEVRKEAALSASYRLGSILPGLRYRFSDEPDYRSHGIGGSASRDFAGHDTTVALSYDLALDTVGRSGTPFSAWSRKLTSHAAELGVTQVLGPRTVARLGYSLTLQNGYMEKPYRYVPLLDSATLDDLERSVMEVGPDEVDAYRLPERPPEEVPDRRVRHALSARGLRYVPRLEGAAQLDYRYYIDSWGVQAHTVDASIKIPIGRFRLDVEDRFHFQTAADFWSRVYTVDQEGTIPTWRTLDRELGSYLQDTLSARLERPFGDFVVYAMGGSMVTYFRDFLYLDWRLALVSEAGVRWRW